MPAQLTYEGVDIPMVVQGLFAECASPALPFCVNNVINLCSTRYRTFQAPGDGRMFRWTLGMWTAKVGFGDA